MNVFISEADRQNAFRVALRNIAIFYGIANIEISGNQELYNAIRDLRVPIFKELNEYFNAYNNWFAFYQKIKGIEQSKGGEHELTEAERSELTGLIQQRKEKLDNLQKTFDQLQFDRFKKLHGLGNVEGLTLEDKGWAE